MQTVTVYVTPAQGYEFRARAGRQWSKGTHVVRVVEHPSEPDEVTPAQLDALKADRPFFVIESEAPVEDVAALKAQIADLNAQVAQLTAHLESLTKPKGK